MSDFKFTIEQDNAIRLRNRNLLVSAAAGSGKTTVLVERIMRMATDPENPVDIDRMLVVTFTNAAAAEMKERVRNSLFAHIRMNPGDERLRNQLVLLNQANISTIHSFCSDVIRSNYHLLDIDPAFSVSDATESGLILGKAVENIIAYKYEENDGSFIKLADGFGRGRDDAELVKLIKSIYKYIRSMPGYREWITKKAALFYYKEADFRESKWGIKLIEYGLMKLRGGISETNEAMSLIHNNSDFTGYHTTLVEDLLMLEGIAEMLGKGSWDDCAEVISAFKFIKLKVSSRKADKELQKIVKDTRDRIKKDVNGLKRMITGSSSDIIENLRELAPVMTSLSEIVNAVDEEYRKLKNKSGVLDYNDLEHYALMCLKGEAGSMYRLRFDEVMVDEYQDSNPIQEEIIKLVSGRNQNEKNTFMVGDVKQSIYKFRQAMPELFLTKYREYSTDISDGDVRIELFTNYRSRKPILDFTNYIFSGIMSMEAGGIDYNDDVALFPGLEYPDNNEKSYSVDIRLICGEDKDLFTGEIGKETKEAAAVGAEIIKLIKSEFLIIDKKNSKKQKAVEFRDITILMRTMKNSSTLYEKQLKSMGIPVISEGDSDFFNEYEIKVMLSFLEILDNPRQDIPLIAVMRSIMFGFTDKELALLRVGTRNEKYYDSLTTFSGNTALKVKVNDFLGKIEEYRRVSQNTPVDKLIWQIMHETGFLFKCRNGEKPEIRQANLRKLFEIAGSYEKSRLTGVFGFMSYIKTQIAQGADISGIDQSAGNSNSVRILSIHKSKGLEFPVVILAGTGRKFNKQESRAQVVLDREMGLGPNYVDAEKGFWLVTAAKKAICAKSEMENMAEEMRVLYVALTRAREKLVITGYVSNPEKESIKWILNGRKRGGRINPGTVMGATSHLEWIMSGISDRGNYEIVMETAGLTVKTVHARKSHYNIKYMYPTEIRQLLDGSVKVNETTGQELELSYKELRDRFAWEYPYVGERGIHKKISVTELKKLRENEAGAKDMFDSQFIEKPSFMDDEAGADAAEKGILLHNVLSAADIKKAYDRGYVVGLLEKAGASEYELAKFTDIIIGFFKSSLGRRMTASKESMTEKAFLLPMKTTDIYPDKKDILPETHTTLVQGVIDCMFYENGNIVLLDYKSDNVLPGNEKEHAKRYAVQLNIYAKAIERLIGTPVSEKHIYFLRSGSDIEIS